MKDYYKILELPFGAASMEIKSSYRRLAFKYHPDKNLNDKIAEEKFKEITEAYMVLSDDNRRIIYHAEYNDFLNNRYVTRIPDTSSYNPPRYYNPTDIPKQPRGPASSYEDNFDGVRIAVLSFLIIMLTYLLFQTYRELKERERKRKLAAKNIIIVPAAKTANRDTISADDFYKVISQEFMLTGDSTLLKSNIDSLKHVFDSLQHVSKN